MAHIDLLEVQKTLSTRNDGAGRSLRRLAAGALLLLAGGGYAIYHVHARPEPAPVAVPATPVHVLRLTPRTVHPFAEFSGRISAVDYAEIRPQVAGRITQIRFRDGQLVKAGDVLFVIDPRPYQAAVVQAEGNLASAVNNARLARIERERGARLIKVNALAQELQDQRVNADNVAEAAVKAAQGALAAARLNVDYAYVKAPISGRISRAEITVGNYVGAPTVPPPLLASIVSNDGVYADFEVDEQTYLDNVRAQGRGPIPVDLVVQGDKGGRAWRGVIESFDNHIDSGSGTIRARARFANEDGSLVPGMFVSVRLGGASLAGALLALDSAIGNDQSKRFVYVVGADDKAQYRPVTLGDEVDGSRVVTSGLKPGDRLILDGLQKLAPGSPVRPEMVKTAAN